MLPHRFSGGQSFGAVWAASGHDWEMFRVAWWRSMNLSHFSDIVSLVHHAFFWFVCLKRITPVFGLFVFLLSLCLAYECHNCLDKCHTPFIHPYQHKLPTRCLRVDAWLMFVMLGYISTWVLLFFLRPPFSKTLSLQVDSLILATCFLIFLMSSRLTVSTSKDFSTLFIYF